jgi:hypothetical protein
MRLLPDHPVGRSVNLAFNVASALEVPWFQWIRSVLGNPSSYTAPPSGYQTELSALSLETAACALLPWARTLLESGGSGPLAPVGAAMDTHPEERWLFINGICTEQKIAELNANMLARMFQRRIEILYNATDGIALDLYECALGKGFDTITEAVAQNLKPFVEALSDPVAERVVLVSHSQGTIVAAVMLKWLEEVLSLPGLSKGPGEQKPSPERRVAQRLAGKHGTQDRHYQRAQSAYDLAVKKLTPNHIAKLELYCFANCATAMNPIVAVGMPPRHAPWIESYGNEYDLIARLGVLAPPHGIGSARIEGERYRRDGAWGHLLNAHYLVPMIADLTGTSQARALAPFRENLFKAPRLYGYYQGGKPSLPYP